MHALPKQTAGYVFPNIVLSALCLELPRLAASHHAAPRCSSIQQRPIHSPRITPPCFDPRYVRHEISSSADRRTVSRGTRDRPVSTRFLSRFSFSLSTCGRARSLPSPLLARGNARPTNQRTEENGREKENRQAREKEKKRWRRLRAEARTKRTKIEAGKLKDED